MPGTPELGDAAVSRREAEVLACLGENLTYAEIGARLHISERTVESHVGSLRRKLGVEDRRALVRLSAERRTLRAGSTLVSPASSFVGRADERARLTDAVDGARLVSVVGAGGIGKTRLAIAVAAGLEDRFERVWYTDLVPVADPAMVPSAVLRAVGLTEVPVATTEQTLVGGIGHRPGLLVVDNCEHVLHGVATLVEHLLSRCHELHVLLTSRVRLATPLEHVFPLPELALADAVELFTTRAASAGSPTRDRSGERVARICAGLDRLPLAIELAAARVPSLGLDGVEAALAPAHRFALLTGGSRADGRHTSLQSTLDWSYRLLGPRHQAVFRRVSVFASTFTADAAADVAGFAPVDPGGVWAILGELVDHHLLAPVGAGEGTRYRLLETMRQYGAQHLGADGPPARSRHVDWCLDTATRLDEAHDADATWRAAVDRIADEMRSAIVWAAPDGGRRADARRLTTLLAGLLFRRGRPTEAQERYRQAADLTDDGLAAAATFAAAAAVAKCRVRGDEALALERAGADAAAAAGDTAGTALALGRIVELSTRWEGMFATPPSRSATEDLLAEARALVAPGDPTVDAALAVAAAYVDRGGDRAEELSRTAVDRARAAGAPVLESAALDALDSALIRRGDIAAAAATSRQRVELLGVGGRTDPPTAMELKDALHMAVYTSIAVGDLPGACRYARHERELPFLGAEDDLANEEVLAPTALAGHWDQTLPAAERFLDVWTSAGRPAAPGRSLAPAAVAMVHGLRGDEDARAVWLAAFATMHGLAPHEHPRGTGYGEVFDAIVLLHQGRPAEARTVLGPEPDTVGRLFGPLFRQWYLALRAEAAVLDRADDADDAHDAEPALAEARAAAAGNPVATAIATRAAGLRHHDPDALHAAADAFHRAGCPYQWARTLVLAGHPTHDQGQRALADLGASPLET